MKELSYNHLAVGAMEPLVWGRSRSTPWVRLVIDGEVFKLNGDLAAQLGRRLQDYARIAKASA